MIPKLTDDGRGFRVDATCDGAKYFEVEGRKEVKFLSPCEGGDGGPNAAGRNSIGE